MSAHVQPKTRSIHFSEKKRYPLEISHEITWDWKIPTDTSKRWQRQKFASAVCDATILARNPTLDPCSEMKKWWRKTKKKTSQTKKPHLWPSCPLDWQIEKLFWRTVTTSTCEGARCYARARWTAKNFPFSNIILPGNCMRCDPSSPFLQQDLACTLLLTIQDWSNQSKRSRAEQSTRSDKQSYCEDASTLLS